MKIKIILAMLGAFALLTSFQLTKSNDIPKSKKGMIKVMILYPNGEGKEFDMEYYATKHMPMIASLMGDSLKLLEIDKGVAAGAPDAAVPFLAIGYLYFDKLSAFQNTFGPNAAQIRADIQNYTNIQPVVQISEVLQ